MKLAYEHVHLEGGLISILGLLKLKQSLAGKQRLPVRESIVDFAELGNRIMKIVT